MVLGELLVFPIDGLENRESTFEAGFRVGEIFPDNVSSGKIGIIFLKIYAGKIQRAYRIAI
jgi:hypothetical protein